MPYTHTDAWSAITLLRIYDLNSRPCDICLVI